MKSLLCLTPLVVASCLAFSSPAPPSSPDLLGAARQIIDKDMGLAQPDLLSSDFRLVQAFRPCLNKQKYLSEYGAYGIREAFPDLFWNGHDIRVDKSNPSKVWATIRVAGTHRGALKFEGKDILPADSTRINGAPECLALEFDEDGLCTKLTSGFCLDRSTGNTGPVGGIWGLLEGVGEGVNSFRYLPPTKVISSLVSRSFRSVEQLRAPPLPEPLLFALAQQLFKGLADPDTSDAAGSLMDDRCEFIGPAIGPLRKNEIVDAVKKTAASDNFAFYDARIDPFEPARVWATIQSKDGGKSEAVSVTFNKLGFASKITGGYIMDPEEDGSMASVFGVMQEALPRPVPEALLSLVPQPQSKPKPAAKPMPKLSAVKEVSKPSTSKAAAPVAKPPKAAAKPAAPVAKPPKAAAKPAAPVAKPPKAAAKPAASVAKPPKAAAKPAAPVAKPTKATPAAKAPKAGAFWSKPKPDTLPEPATPKAPAKVPVSKKLAKTAGNLKPKRW
ncbi:unnamed protein product [Chrysoparadoxa australica]